MGTPTSILESPSLDFFYLSVYPTLLFLTNKALFTTIFLPRHNKQHRSLFGACHHCSFTSQMGCCWVTQWTPQPLLGSKHAVSTSSKQENILLLNRFCSLVRRRIKCIRDPLCLKNFRVCYSLSDIHLIRMFHFESFCAYNRLWGQSRLTALRWNAGNNYYYFQAGNIFTSRTNIYL